VDFTSHIAFKKAILGSQGTFIASRAMLTRLQGAKLVSIETVIASHRACVASQEAVIGS